MKAIIEKQKEIIKHLKDFATFHVNGKEKLRQLESELSALEADEENKQFCPTDKEIEELYLNMQYYMEYCRSNEYVTPKEWIEKHKHW